MPVVGEIVLFDRSWYNRAGVEHVMGFCTPEAYQGVPREKIKLPPRQDRAYVRPPQREQNYVPTRYHVV